MADQDERKQKENLKSGESKNSMDDNKTGLKEKRRSEIQQNTAFGEIARELGIIGEEEVKEALIVQKKAKKLDLEVPKIGEVLISKGHITEEQAREIFRIQGMRGGHTEIEGFQLQKKIGQGSMGSVFKAHQVSMDRTVALKILAPKLAKDERYVKRFFSEARSVAQLNHPNIVQGIDVGESNGVYYFVMEYLDGPTVGEIIKRGGAMDQSRALKFATHITRALKHAEKNRMIHCDVKPENIMINSSRNAKLCDLGLTKILTEESKDQRVALGTPNYISPEQANQNKNLDIRTDIYSLGASFYHMLTGRPPFTGESSKDIIRKHFNTPLLPPDQIEEQIHPEISNIVRRMMKKDRNDRYQGPEEALEDMQAVQNELNANQESNQDEPDQSPKPRKRRRFRRGR